MQWKKQRLNDRRVEVYALCRLTNNIFIFFEILVCVNSREPLVTCYQRGGVPFCGENGVECYFNKDQGLKCYWLVLTWGV